RIGGRHGLRRDGRPRRRADPDRPVLPRRIVRPVRALPGRDRPPGRAAGAAGCRPEERHARGRAGAAPGHRPGDARRVDLRPRPAGARGDRERAASAGAGGAVSLHPRPPPDEPVPEILLEPPARSSRPPVAPPAPERAAVELTIDGAAVTVPAG